MVITPYDYQRSISAEALEILQQHGIVYLAMEERTGKSVTGLLIAEALASANKILILTKKKALPDWEQLLQNCPWLNKQYTVTNYHAASKVAFAPDLVILDESHSYLSAFPKPGAIWKTVKTLCVGKPIVYMSATPYAQGMHLLFHQLALSSYSPWKSFKNYYSWYFKYAKLDAKGARESIWVAGRLIETYKSVDGNQVFPTVKHLFITKTRAELNFKVEPTDNLHYVELSPQTKAAYNILVERRVLVFDLNKTEYTLLADSNAKLRASLHMLEGGVLKIDDIYLVLNSSEKIDYIMKIWGDTEDLVIMYHYIAEGTKLRRAFKKAKILQGVSYAEGIDLSGVSTLVIYSQDFSAARYIQRRARQANKDREDDIEVNFLLVRKGVSEQVYTTVSVLKRNFTDKLFNPQEI